MSGKTKFADKYVPCILTRITDDNPQSHVDSQEKVISLEKVKQEILFNISQILNSRSRPQYNELNNDPEIIRSVLGFGLSDFCGVSNTAKEVSILINEIKEQIKCFEPRLDPASIEVTLKEGVNLSNCSFALEIKANYAIKSLEGSFLCLSYLDLESGFASVEDNA
ncbi:MAG: GPW/gp25 family protein [Succinivibrio sp.]|nr:GPW/gp25 family protein [Succinivibrio sp.]